MQIMAHKDSNTNIEIKQFRKPKGKLYHVVTDTNFRALTDTVFQLTRTILANCKATAEILQRNFTVWQCKSFRLSYTANSKKIVPRKYKI